jgi:NAD(P) transhydrogenase subunit alpha
VRPPRPHLRANIHEAQMLREGGIYIGFLDPTRQSATIELLARRRVTAYALEFVPRIARAQSMDALTAMATVAGYKAVLLAAERLPKMLPLLMTAAGTVAPATVLVLGTGVAGLQSIATARRLGARVEAFDPRPVVREQIQSLGATFVEMPITEEVETAGGYAREQSEAFLQRERDTISQRLRTADIVICSAQVFGKPAPVLITAEMLSSLRPGAVIVDLAADQGGNCALTRPGETLVHAGVSIIGASNLPVTVPVDASQLFAHTVVNLFRYLYPSTGPAPDLNDPIVRETCVTRDGAIVSATMREPVFQGGSA